MSLADFSTFYFSHGGSRFLVYKRGTGPGILVMTEMPGITPQVVAFAERLIDAGFTVWMPHLFGEDGREVSPGYLLKSLFEVCVRKEFAALAANRSSPIADALRAMCRGLHAEAGGKGVGAIGMCFTGNFALSLMLEESMLAPVLCQPSLPIITPTRSRKAAIHLSPEELEVCKRRTKEGVRILGMRFTEDPVCRVERFDTLRHEFGDAFEAIEIDSRPGNPFGIPKSAHSVLTNHFVDKAGNPTRIALDRTLEFFGERLRA